MTPFEYYLAHAPEAPDWFRHHNPDPEPEHKTLDHLEQLKRWSRKNQRERWIQWRLIFAASMGGLTQSGGQPNALALGKIKALLELNS